MILVLERGTPEEEQQAVLAELPALGLEGRLLTVADVPLIHLTSGPSRAARRLLRRGRVEALVATSGPRIRREGRRFYPYHFVNVASSLLLVIGALILVASFFPTGLGQPIDPRGSGPPLEVPWFLRAPVAVEAAFPAAHAWVGMLAVVAILVALVLLPLADRGRHARVGGRAVVLLGGALFLGLYAWLTWGGQVA